MANGSGTTTKGAAIAVAQHGTKLPESVTLAGGTLSGVKDVAVTDVNSDMSDVTVIVAEVFTESSEIPELCYWAETETSDVYRLSGRRSVIGTTIAVAQAVYTGAELAPSITVADSEGSLTVGDDYTVAVEGTVQDAGDYAVTITGVGSWIDSTNVTFTIARRPVTITVAGTTDTSLTYNGSEQSVTVDSGKYSLSCDDALYSAAKVVRADTIAKGTDVKDNYALGLAADQFAYDDANIDPTFDVTDGTFAITKAAITIAVAAVDQTATYTGEDITKDVKLTDAYTLSSEDALYDASKVTRADTTVTGKNVGTYEYGLTAEQFVYDDENVTATFTVAADGKLTVEKAAITIAVAAVDQTATYTGEDITKDVKLTDAYTLSSSDALYDATKVTRTDTTVTGKDVGSYDYGLTADQFGYNDENVTATFTVAADGKLTIGPKAVTVTAENKTKISGNADPELTATVEGVLEGDEIAYALSREAGEGAGEYAITPTGEETQGNYTVSYVAGTLTIGGAKAMVSYVDGSETVVRGNYATLAEAAGEAVEGDTITLLADVSDEGVIALGAGVTLDGAGNKVSGDTQIAVNSAGGAVKDVAFDNIGTRKAPVPAITTADGLAGELEVTGCTFTNDGYVKTDIVVKPVAGAKVTITGNTFSGLSGTAVIVDPASEDAVDYEAEVTDNVFRKTGTATRAFAVVGAADAAKLAVSSTTLQTGLRSARPLPART